MLFPEERSVDSAFSASPTSETACRSFSSGSPMLLSAIGDSSFARQRLALRQPRAGFFYEERRETSYARFQYNSRIDILNKTLFLAPEQMTYYQLL